MIFLSLMVDKKLNFNKHLGFWPKFRKKQNFEQNLEYI